MVGNMQKKNQCCGNSVSLVRFLLVIRSVCLAAAAAGARQEHCENHCSVGSIPAAAACSGCLSLLCATFGAIPAAASFWHKVYLSAVDDDDNLQRLQKRYTYQASAIVRDRNKKSCQKGHRFTKVAETTNKGRFLYVIYV
jgi:hypothetical protein